MLFLVYQSTCSWTSEPTTTGVWMCRCHPTVQKPRTYGVAACASTEVTALANHRLWDTPVYIPDTGHNDKLPRVLAFSASSPQMCVSSYQTFQTRSWSTQGGHPCPVFISDSWILSLIQFLFFSATKFAVTCYVTVFCKVGKSFCCLNYFLSRCWNPTYFPCVSSSVPTHPLGIEHQIWYM